MVGMETPSPLIPAPRFKLLEAWKMAAALSVEIFRLTDLPPLNHRRGLCDQMQRSGVSIPSNVAEGEERGTNKDSLRFLFIAKGSLAELRTQMDIAHSIGAYRPRIMRHSKSLSTRLPGC